MQLIKRAHWEGGRAPGSSERTDIPFFFLTKTGHIWPIQQPRGKPVWQRWCRALLGAHGATDARPLLLTLLYGPWLTLRDLAPGIVISSTSAVATSIHAVSPESMVLAAAFMPIIVELALILRRLCRSAKVCSIIAVCFTSEASWSAIGGGEAAISAVRWRR